MHIVCESEEKADEVREKLILGGINPKQFYTNYQGFTDFVLSGKAERFLALDPWSDKAEPRVWFQISEPCAGARFLCTLPTFSSLPSWTEKMGIDDTMSTDQNGEEWTFARVRHRLNVVIENMPERHAEIYSDSH